MSSITHEIALDNFHSQIRFVLDGYQPHGRKSNAYQNTIIGGLGGSGIGGRIAKLAFYDKFPISIENYSEYQLPAYANSKTLVILSSYSGNTEETLGMYADAKAKGCDIIVLSSGGKISELAQTDGYPVYQSAAGYQPRMALGFSLTTLLLVLGELCGLDMRPQLESTEEMLKNNSPAMKKQAVEMLNVFRETLNNKFVVVCDLAFEAVAIRFCQQIQENAKAECFISVLPEANHNMIESYYQKRNTNFIFLNSGINKRNDLRFNYLNSVLEPKGNVIYHFPISPFNIQCLFEVIHTTDWLSILISNELGEDNMQVGIISGLKNFLDNN